MKERNKGITLIALVITIIVMLILVAVTINMAINGGLFNYAGKATGDTKNAIKEEQQLANGGVNIDGTWYNSIDEYLNKDKNETQPLDWTAILADANANPEKYRHSEQQSTNKDIGIGTDGKPVNMDLWKYIEKSGEISLYEPSSCSGRPGYSNSNIIDGKIQGKVPQYIKPEGKDEFYPVTSMDLTFCYCSSLVIAPEIPISVTSMFSTFEYCTSLTNAPEIPSGVSDLMQTFVGCTNLTKGPEIPNSVTNMFGTFSGCSNLTGNLVINATNLESCYVCLNGAATAEGTSLTVTGSCPQLAEIIATAGEDSHITNRETE